MTFVFPLAISSKSYLETVEGNTVFVLTTSGGYVFGGAMVTLTMLRLRITTRRQKR